MNIILLSVLISIVVGAIDALPMILKKLPKRAIVSAFLQYLFVSVIIINIDLPNVVWWIEGGLIALMMAIPIIIIIAETDKKSVPIILANAVVLGTLIALAGHFLK
ncbi:hypothetical protein [Bacteroides fragilis]|uniref:hypothetical protein n=1 Tax=Bacteroides fragilis TaxID=817 RepID=UPI0032EF9A2E